MDPLYRINDVEIFSAGTWNDDTYTIEDLYEMVRAFQETGRTIRPYLKLGHDPDQKLVQKDGLPAAGWIDNLRVIGSKLIADFIDIPKKIFQMIENKSYRNVSAEILFNGEFNGETYGKALLGVALLGADTPAVSNLMDIVSWYALKYEKARAYSKKLDFSMEGDKMADEKEFIKLDYELKDEKKRTASLQIKLDEITKNLETSLASFKNQEATVKELTDIKSKYETQEKELREQIVTGERETFISNLEKKNLISVAMRPFVLALLEDKKEYKVKEKQFNRNELIEEVLKLHSATNVNLDENSDRGQETTGNEDEQDVAIRKIAADRKISYKEAYKEYFRKVS